MAVSISDTGRMTCTGSQIKPSFSRPCDEKKTFPLNFITELKIYHDDLCYSIYAHNSFENSDPSNVLDGCRTWTL